MYRHYVTVDDRGRITAGYSTGEHPGIGPGETDELVTDRGGVAFALLGVEHPALFTDDTARIPLYAWTGVAVRARTQEEIDADRPAPEPDPEPSEDEDRDGLIVDLMLRVTMLELGLNV